VLIHVEPIVVGVDRKIIKTGVFVEKNPEMWIIKNKSVGGPVSSKSIFLKKKRKKVKGERYCPKCAILLNFSDNRCL